MKPFVDNLCKQGWKKQKAAGGCLANANSAEDKTSKLQYKLLDRKDPYGGSIHPAAADL